MAAEAEKIMPAANSKPVVATNAVPLAEAPVVVSQSPMTADRYSPDGKWWWDGTAWTAVARMAPSAQAVMPPPITTPSGTPNESASHRMRRRNLVASAVVLLVGVIALLPTWYTTGYPFNASSNGLGLGHFEGFPKGYFSNWVPYNWLFVVGLLLVVAAIIVLLRQVPPRTYSLRWAAILGLGAAVELVGALAYMAAVAGVVQGSVASTDAFGPGAGLYLAMTVAVVTGAIAVLAFIVARRGHN